MMEKSALPARTKMVVLTQELLRRMKNTSPRLDPQESIDILSGLMLKMARSGYSIEQRREVLRTRQRKCAQKLRRKYNLEVRVG